ncbi:hypothetical protein SVIO_012790 [Streptomyces violaceusniger]|uniref:Uncharacterized protein n=1 Tax=Streptomyces violaceusniger TaxID=68280 RepID=A0A4D4KUU8_STRVO|nr:hypothetical protein SVIO_012790 [Streptomyces violaceusniger]
MADALARYVRDRQTLPDPAIVIEHDDGDLVLDRDIASEAGHKARETGLPHNLARPHFAFRVIDSLTDQLVDRIGADPLGGPNLLGADDVAQLGKAIAVNPEVHAAIAELWPVLTPQQLVADFLSDPVHLSEADAAAIRRTDGEWTPPTCRCWTRPPNSSATTTRRPAPPRRPNARSASSTHRASSTSPTAPAPRSSRTARTRSRRCWPPTTSSTPSGWPTAPRSATTAAPPNAPPPTAPGPSATSSWTRPRSCPRWRGGC